MDCSSVVLVTLNITFVAKMNKRRSYSASFKKSAIKRASLIGNRKAAQEIGVDETQVRRWRANRIRIVACESTRRAFRGPKQGEHGQLEDVVAEFVIEKRKNGLPVTAQLIQKKARAVSDTLNIENFKACRGWVDKFMKRKGFSLRRRTTICQKLPADFEQKLVEYQRYVINLRQKFQFSLSHIGNADETPIWLDMPRNYSVDVTGSKQIPIKTSGYEKQRVTVMLCVTADGHKLPPYIILKRKLVPKPTKNSETFPSGVIVRAQVKGWMTEDLMVDWLRCVWARRPGAIRQLPSMLSLDAFRGHLTESVKKEVRRLKSEMVVIPGGMTSMLQPLDVSINKPFKVLVQNEYDKWMEKENHELTPAGKIKKASPFEVAKWIKKAWDSIDAELVRRSFLKCCLSNALDGSEDDDLWETRNETEVIDSSESETEIDSESDSGQDESDEE